MAAVLRLGDMVGNGNSVHGCSVAGIYSWASPEGCWVQHQGTEPWKGKLLPRAAGMASWRRGAAASSLI